MLQTRRLFNKENLLIYDNSSTVTTIIKKSSGINNKFFRLFYRSTVRYHYVP